MNNFRFSRPDHRESRLRLLAWTVVVLAAAVAGCGDPEANWFWRPASPAPAGRASFLAAHRDAPATVAGPVDPGSDDGADEADGVDKVDGVDEFDELEEELADQMIEVADPLQGWNRAMFQFNDGLYFHMVKPVLEAYAKLTPEDARIGIRNSFDNLAMPVRLVNCLLQGRWEAAGTELRRFGINTTVGILGFNDVARTKHGLEPVQADMGQTLAVYGLGDGCYLVWPIVGPSTVRDTAGSVPDMFMDPLWYVRPWPVSLGVSSLKVTNNGSLKLGLYEALTSDALDPYLAVRQAYIQHRGKQLQKDKPTTENETASPDTAAPPPSP